MDKQSMNASSYLGYGIIGTSDGFVAQTAGMLAGSDIGRVVDLDNRQIFAPFDTEIIAGIREERDGHLYTYFVLYRYAVEQERSRLGGFYGSVVALKDCTADGFAIYNLLLELATNVKVYLDPETRRFLVPLEDISFLHPDSVDELLRSVKKMPETKVRSAAYFAPLPPHSRNCFRFIDFFQHEAQTIERFFVSNDQEVVDLVKNKAGLTIKSLILENAVIERKLEQYEKIESDIFHKGKELDLVSQQLEKAKQSLAHLEAQQNTRNQQLDQLGEELDQLSSQKQQLSSEILQIQREKQQLTKQLKSASTSLEKTAQSSQKSRKPSGAFKENNKDLGKIIRDQLRELHPVTRMLVLVLAFAGLGTLGYMTITGFGKNKQVLPKKEVLIPPIDELSTLENQIRQEYLGFDKVKQDSFLKRLDPFLSSETKNISDRALQLQKYVLTIGYDYYKMELKRTDTIPVLHGQLVEEFEILKNEYDSVFLSLK